MVILYSSVAVQEAFWEIGHEPMDNRLFCEAGCVKQQRLME